MRYLALKFIVDNGKEIVAQAGWRGKLKVGPGGVGDYNGAYNRRCILRSWPTCLKLMTGLPPNKSQEN